MAEESSASPAFASTSTMQAFASLGSIVDGRILRSLASQGFTQPTPIQSTVLPLAITQNKDILARAKTGSGKTLAYAIPLVQKILSARAKLEDGYSNPNYLATRALVLVPTRELAEQITAHITTLCEFFKDRDAIRIVNVAGSSQSSKGKSSQDKVQKCVLFSLDSFYTC
jgi:ATP-dependent RNA helicase DDX56/DBP9